MYVIKWINNAQYFKFPIPEILISSSLLKEKKYLFHRGMSAPTTSSIETKKARDTISYSGLNTLCRM